MLEILVICAMATATLAFGFWFGRWHLRRGYKRVIRKTRGGRSYDLSFHPGEDGTIELWLPGFAMKELRRGNPLTAILEGKKGSMAFRVRRV